MDATRLRRVWAESVIANAYGGELPQTAQPKIRKVLLQQKDEQFEFERRDDGGWWCGEVRVDGDE